MKQRVELTTQAGSPAEAEAYFRAGADVVIVGEARYALRLAGSMDIARIERTVAIAKRFGKRVYIAMTALLHEREASTLDGYLAELARIGPDAVVFGDRAVLMAARRVAPNMTLHWNAETTSTNYRTANFWAKRGASRAVAARELTMEEVADMVRHSIAEVQAQVHGMTCIFHSKRTLIQSYRQHLGLTPLSAEEGKAVLREEKREELHQYPIFEDRHGTHVMSDSDLCLLEYLPMLLDSGVHALYIETAGKLTEANALIIKVYREAIDRYLAAKPEGEVWSADQSWDERLQSVQPPDRPFSTGFYFKKQVY